MGDTSSLLSQTAEKVEETLSPAEKEHQKNVVEALLDLHGEQYRADPKHSQTVDRAKKEIERMNYAQQRQMLKSMLTSLDFDPSAEFCAKMDHIINNEKDGYSITTLDNLRPQAIGNIVMWQGDITTLEVDAIVNAANEWLLGCFAPNHPCIDNAIHCRAGPQLRAACREVVKTELKGKLEVTGVCKITTGFNLPCKWVCHTVGPRCGGTGPQPDKLASCYITCLDAASKVGARSIAFCCISTGVFGYPNEPAAKVALETVRTWLNDPANAGKMDLVVFNVFLDKDKALYEKLIPQFFGPNAQPDAKLETDEAPAKKQKADPIGETEMKGDGESGGVSHDTTNKVEVTNQEPKP
eukprot:TRINITY_DN66180_c2_g13_i1.p1 TRINITY_DN66180_c2_g13~~TRINITY_DN66180_c2_g13_i1.p1  ORF type:complete len:354 (+),score=47.06 TRINITY_DN66180_c2_g13_i1:57-1118(+)